MKKNKHKKEKKTSISKILDDIYYSHFEYSMDNMGKYLEMLEKKQEIMQKKLPPVSNFVQQGQSEGNFL